MLINRHVIAQSVQFSKTAKKLNIDLCQFFSHRKEALSLLKSWLKNGGHRTRFCGRAAESAHQKHFLRFLREDWGEFRNRMYVKRGKKELKNPFLQNLHRDITFRTQCDKESFWMKIKVSKHKLNIHYRGSPRGSRTRQHAYCLRYAHSQHIESHLGKKQQQAKIPIAFLLSQLHFNNITSHAVVYGGHLVMRSKRCAVQN